MKEFTETELQAIVLKMRFGNCRTTQVGKVLMPITHIARLLRISHQTVRRICTHFRTQAINLSDDEEKDDQPIKPYNFARGGRKTYFPPELVELATSQLTLKKMTGMPLDLRAVELSKMFGGHNVTRYHLRKWYKEAGITLKVIRFGKRPPPSKMAMIEL